MRVIAGAARGREIQVADQARPYLAKTRGAIFNALMNHLSDARVLDLYAGSGINAIEALSRGAARAVLVENSRAAVAAIRKNIETCGFAECAEICPMRVADFLRGMRVNDAESRFDLIFMDPPFAETGNEKTCENELAAAAALLADAGKIIFRRETGKNAPPLPLPPALRVARSKIYGRSQMVFYERAVND